MPGRPASDTYPALKPCWKSRIRRTARQSKGVHEWEQLPLKQAVAVLDVRGIQSLPVKRRFVS